MKAVKPLVPSLPPAVEGLGPHSERLDVPEHHRCRAATAKLVPDAVDVQPVVRQDLPARDRLADAIHQDLRAAARKTSQARRLQPRQHFPQGQLGHLGEMIDLRRAESVDVDLREPLLDISQQLLVPRELKVGMQPALQQNLIAAQGDGFLDLRVEGRTVQHIALGRLRAAVERAEIADRCADVGVVDVAVDVVRAIVLRVESQRHLVGRAAERSQIAAL